MKNQRVSSTKTNIEIAGRTLEDLIERHFPSTLRTDSPKFLDYAWTQLDAKFVIAFLLGHEESYFAHKDILFSGLCAWVVCPNQQIVINQAMLLTAIEFMSEAENQAHTMAPGSRLAAYLLNRVLLVDQDFYSDFYHPIGGLKTIAGSTSAAAFQKSIKQGSLELPSIVALMQIFQVHAEQLRPQGKYRTASLNKACQLVETIHRSKRRYGGISLDNANDRWQKNKTTASLVYAAATIELDDQKSFLETIRDGEANYEEHGSIIPTWIGRARYAVESILVHLHQPDAADKNRSYLPPGESQTIPAPLFDQDDLQEIRKQFKKHGAD